MKNLEQKKELLRFKSNFLEVAVIALHCYKNWGKDEFKNYFEYFKNEADKLSDIIKKI